MMRNPASQEECGVLCFGHIGFENAFYIFRFEVFRTPFTKCKYVKGVPYLFPEKSHGFRYD